MKIERSKGVAPIDVMAPTELPQRLLTASEVASFMADRVIHVSGVLSSDWLERIGAVVDAQTDVGGLQSMKANAWHTDDGMHGIIMNCPLAHLAQQVLSKIAEGPETGTEPRDVGKPIRFFYDQMFVKHPNADRDGEATDQDERGHPGNTPWHHDITFWPVVGEQIVSIWIALDPTNLRNGGLEFVPGSSEFEDRYQAMGVGSKGRLPFGSDTLAPIPKINSATTGETGGSLSAISFNMQAGDILIFDAKILHGAPPNLSERARRGLALRYLGDDVVLDDAKYGEQTSMAPFDCYDESLSNGDKVTGPVYPQVLPEKIPSEVAVRIRAPIAPCASKMARWQERNRAAAMSASVPIKP
ncbi:MAG: hypothetical protein GKR90_07055 [Pseudomonadales bacterium]|nr:hypothetical protein [Pseudomonadales bacterium]